MVKNNLLLEEVVREWAAKALPDEPGVATRAALLARSAYEHGATVTEACEEARAFVGSWARHPSHRREDGALLRLAS